MKHYKCPGCKNDTTKEDTCYLVICACGTMMELVKDKITKEVNSPEIIFKGSWPGKTIKQGKDIKNKKEE